MGDMADFALSNASDEDEHYTRYRNAPLHTQYEEGIIDERGCTIGNPSWGRTHACGPGKCPKCGSGTVKKVGRYGVFYGCTHFPKCKGSRNS